MTTYVLVHGAWHTGTEFEPVAEAIRAEGHIVHCPTIAGNRPGESKDVGLDAAIASIVDYLSDNDLSDVVLLGGSGDYSAGGEGQWLDRSLDLLRDLVELGQPTFASCWGFQAMARAMGGSVVRNLDTAEVGTHRLFLTEAGRDDPIFGSVGRSFLAQMGHEDCVGVLPERATLLASSERNAHQAYRIDDAPIYCTQFHPELTREDLHLRVEAYPQYIERITGMAPDEFIATLEATPRAGELLGRFVETVFAG